MIWCTVYSFYKVTFFFVLQQNQTARELAEGLGKSAYVTVIDEVNGFIIYVCAKCLHKKVYLKLLWI